jgi:hypothetical protein
MSKEQFAYLGRKIFNLVLGNPDTDAFEMSHKYFDKRARKLVKIVVEYPGIDPEVREKILGMRVVSSAYPKVQRSYDYHGISSTLFKYAQKLNYTDQNPALSTLISAIRHDIRYFGKELEELSDRYIWALDNPKPLLHGFHPNSDN